jgi:hypothetical protein
MDHSPAITTVVTSEPGFEKVVVALYLMDNSDAF